MLKEALIVVFFILFAISSSQTVQKSALKEPQSSLEIDPSIQNLNIDDLNAKITAMLAEFTKQKATQEDNKKPVNPIQKTNQALYNRKTIVVTPIIDTGSAQTQESTKEVIIVQPQKTIVNVESQVNIEQKIILFSDQSSQKTVKQQQKKSKEVVNVGLCTSTKQCLVEYWQYVVQGLQVSCDTVIGVCIFVL